MDPFVRRRRLVHFYALIEALIMSYIFEHYHLPEGIVSIVPAPEFPTTTAASSIRRAVRCSKV